MENNHLGLVMSGGGTRGAYQMGIWQALRELGLDKQLHIVVGTSIGAINGAMVLQQNWDKALELWQNVEPQQIFNALETTSGNLYTTLLRDWWQHRGIRVDGLKELLRTHLDEQAIRRSTVGFGLVVYNRSTRRGEELYLEDIPEGLLAEYIIASATFPVFRAHRIGQHEYLDGGIHNNLPTGMAFERRNPQVVIAVDVAESSRFSPQQWRLRRQYADRLIYIRPSRMLPMPTNFSKAAFMHQLEIGYHDGLRRLGDRNLLAAHYF